MADGQRVASFAAGAAFGAGALWLCSRYFGDAASSRHEAADGHLDWAAAAAVGATGRGRGTGGISSTHHAASVPNFDRDEVLVEQLTRNVQFFGLEGQKRIAGSFVVVVGLGVRQGGGCLWGAFCCCLFFWGGRRAPLCCFCCCPSWARHSCYSTDTALMPAGNPKL